MVAVTLHMDRKLAGQCVNCGEPITGDELRCARHTLAKRAADRRRYARRVEGKTLAPGRHCSVCRSNTHQRQRCPRVMVDRLMRGIFGDDDE